MWIHAGYMHRNVLLRAGKPYKFFGPHLGVAYARRELMERWRPYKVRPAPVDPPGKRFETGTLAYELLAGFVAAVEYVESLGWDDILAWERSLGELFLAGLPPSITLHGSANAASRSGTATTTRSR